MLDALGQYSLYIGILLTLVVFVSQWKFKTSENWYAHNLFRLNVAAMILIWMSYIVLVIAFITKDYEFLIVHQYSDDSMSLLERITSAWAQRQGVMILWSALMTTIAVVVTWYMRDLKENRVVGRSLTILYLFSAIIAIFAASPRNPTAFETAADPGFGLGLTPSLLSFWQQIHPPLAFLAYVSFIFPYAAGLAILSLKEDAKDTPPQMYWLNDFFMLLGWALTSLYVVAGSIWGYEENWSGFWAWDPVEVASLVMWFASTLYFHTKSQVPNNHPLRSFTATLGWVSVTFAAFIVRSGLLEGLHTYAQSTENLILSFVFGFLLIGTLLGLYFATKDYTQDELFPPNLFEWREHKSLSHLTTFWILVFGAVFNTIGLIVQVFNAVAFDNNDIPVAFYIVGNGLLLFALAITLVLCELKTHPWSLLAKYVIFGISALLTIPILFFILQDSIVVFIITSILATIFGVLLINFGRTLTTKKKAKRASIQIVHLTILLMLVSYFSVDQSSTNVRVTLEPEVNRTVAEFDLALNAKRIIKGSLNVAIEISVFIDGEDYGVITLTEGVYKGAIWDRGAWIIMPTKDLYFHLEDPDNILGGFAINSPITIIISEKPMASIFRVTFYVLVFVSLIGLYSSLSRRPRSNDNNLLILS
jgi:cytochrome c-type biogenesis protein CcmF